jgi:hypothetical protein
VSLRENVAREPAQMSLWTPGGKYEAKYLAHREAHPEVFDKLVALARRAKDRGWKRIGMRMLWETLRWTTGPTEKDREGFAWNDHLAPYYSREIVRTCPDLASMFEIRGAR